MGRKGYEMKMYSIFYGISLKIREKNPKTLLKSQNIVSNSNNLEEEQR